MSIWGKIAEAARFIIGGEKAGDGDGKSPSDQVAFTIGVVALGAKMAKADGVVTEDEVIAFKEVFKVPESEMKSVARFFDQAKRDVAGFQSYADTLARLFRNNKDILRDVLDGLFHIAKADGIIHPNEEAFLIEVSRRFGFSETEFKYTMARHIEISERCPYDVLEVSREISDPELKRHYRKLVIENHPDKLISRGVPEEFVKLATDKLASINEAYDEIARERGL